VVAERTSKKKITVNKLFDVKRYKTQTKKFILIIKNSKTFFKFKQKNEVNATKTNKKSNVKK
jgi:hypothetical protein